MEQIFNNGYLVFVLVLLILAFIPLRIWILIKSNSSAIKSNKTLAKRIFYIDAAMNIFVGIILIGAWLSERSALFGDEIDYKFLISMALGVVFIIHGVSSLIYKRGN